MIEFKKKIEKCRYSHMSFRKTETGDCRRYCVKDGWDDDKVKDRWSRYIGAMGIEAVRRQANSTILVYGAGGLGIEIAKNLVLSGINSLTL